MSKPSQRLRTWGRQGLAMAALRAGGPAQPHTWLTCKNATCCKASPAPQVWQPTPNTHESNMNCMAHVAVALTSRMVPLHHCCCCYVHNSQPAVTVHKLSQATRAPDINQSNDMLSQPTRHQYCLWHKHAELQTCPTATLPPCTQYNGQ